LANYTKENELGLLVQSVQTLQENLKRIISDIYGGADQLVMASQQVSSASEQLSQSASDQACSIEEVSTTMEEMSSNIEQNADNSKQTEKVSIEANTSIKIVAEKTKMAVEANQEIASKINIINDIAFQTNILALNAAVESARAGEHGKGFSVVASEVRKLAESSKKAADEIVNLADGGLKLSGDARELMLTTHPKIENTSKLIQEISAASIEQYNGASQINMTLQQLNSITQHNASSSEELASSAEELAGQAAQLKEVISFFKIENNNMDSFSNTEG